MAEPDDLFARLFELFQQPGPVNLKLAAEVAHHLAGEREPVDPWAAEEYRELTRLAEYRIEQAAPFPVPVAPDVLPVDSRGWADVALDGFGYVAEAAAADESIDGASPAAAMLAPLVPALAGMQIGMLAGSLSRYVMASFDAGLPLDPPRAIAYVVPVVDRFSADHGFDPRQMRMWVAANEVAHRALFAIPFVLDHLIDLLRGFTTAIRPDPQQLMEGLGGMDPTALQGALEGGGLEGLFDTEAAEQARLDLEAFLGLTTGFTRLTVERAAGELLPDLRQIYEARDADRDDVESPEGATLTGMLAGREAIASGRAFCLEVERRFGDGAAPKIWSSPTSIPTRTEIADPVGWAARVLLDETDLGL